MVKLNSLCDLFEDLSKIPALNLPSYKPSFLIVGYENYDEKQTDSKDVEYFLPFAASEVFNSRICRWRKLTTAGGDCKTAYEITFDTMGINFSFRPGDTIGIIPHNPASEVNFILEHLNLTMVADNTYTLSVNSDQKRAKRPVHIPVSSTLRHILTHCLDLRGVVKKLFLLALSKYTKDENERRVLEYLSSKEGSTAYTTHILNKSICMLDLFKIFKSCKPPIEVLLEYLSRLLPRPYSIVNSGIENPNEVKICFSVMEIANNRKGLTTGWMEQIINLSSLENMVKNISLTDKKCICDTKIPIYFRKNVNKFSFPDSCEKPILLIGPGTGVAPFIGFLEERKYYKENNKLDMGLVWLLFGCRNPKLDFIYEEELKEFVYTNVLNKLTTAFSRFENAEFKYVQDALLKNGKEVTALLKEGASVYVCGDVKTISAQVKDALVQCLLQYDEQSQEEAEKFICDMQKENRYLVDSWN